MLYRSYKQTSNNREDTLQDAFPRAVASLMQRFTEGRQIECYQVQMKNGWRIPEAHITAPDEKGLDIARSVRDTHQMQLLCCNRQICLYPQLQCSNDKLPRTIPRRQSLWRIT